MEAEGCVEIKFKRNKRKYALYVVYKVLQANYNEAVVIVLFQCSGPRHIF